MHGCTTVKKRFILFINIQTQRIEEEGNIKIVFQMKEIAFKSIEEEE